MAKIKYAVKNGNNILGYMWDVGEGKEIFITDGKIDINHPLEIRGADGKDIDNIDLMDLLVDILPR